MTSLTVPLGSRPATVRDGGFAQKLLRYHDEANELLSRGSCIPTALESNGGHFRRSSNNLLYSWYLVVGDINIVTKTTAPHLSSFLPLATLSRARPPAE